MNKKLIDLFELDDSPDVDPNPTPLTKKEVEELTAESYSNLEKIEKALPQVTGLELGDLELDELASLAISGYKDLADFGLQVDSRFASEIFQAAGTMLGHAITARTAKINKKLKMIELQLKKAVVDQKTASVKEIDSAPEGQGTLLDRNELLKVLMTNRKNNTQDK